LQIAAAEFFSGQESAPSICSNEHEDILAASMGANIAQIKDQTSTDGVEFMNSAQDAEGSPWSNSRHGDEGIKPNRAVEGRTFDATKMQGLPVYQAFHEAGSIGSRRQMSPMQKHGVQTYCLRGLWQVHA
jgi:hypothetical protein